MQFLDNEQVFNSTVQEMLAIWQVDYLEQTPESLLQSVSHGEASEISALNLIIQAHVAHLLIDVWTPFEQDAWTTHLAEIKSQFPDGLESCHEILVSLRPQEINPEAQTADAWWSKIIPEEYGLRKWDDIGDSFFKGSLLSFITMWDQFTAIIMNRPDVKPDPLLTVTEGLSASGLRFTTWRKLFTANVIQMVIDSNTELDFERWAQLVDSCALLIDQSTTNARGYDVSQTYEDGGNEFDTTHIDFIDVSPVSKEAWAWQFGRVVGLARDVEYSEFGIYDGPFSEWGNGVVALSLLLGSGKPLDWSGRWIGANAYCGDETLEEVRDIRVTSHLYWLMQIGVLNVVRGVTSKEKPVAEDVRSTDDSQSRQQGTEVLLLGDIPKLAEELAAALQTVERNKTERITAEVKDCLPHIWEMLPGDSHDHIVAGELDIDNTRPKGAALNYANSVEAAIREWFPKPKSVNWWPEKFADWTLMLREFIGSAPRTSKIDAFRGRSDPKFAPQLLDALELFRIARLPEAHPEERLPSARRAQQLIKGGADGPSVFELLLRFGQRWKW